MNAFAAQRDSYCGPCCLSACFFMLGLAVSPEDIGEAVGGRKKLRKEGADEYDLAAVAKSLGIKTEQLLVENKSKGKKFCNSLRKHLRKGPALLTTNDLEHWVAAIAAYEGKFVLFDPAEGEKLSLVGEKQLQKLCWNRSDVLYEPDQYFALLLWK